MVTNYKPIPAATPFKTKTIVSDVADKGKGCLITATLTGYDDKGDKYFDADFRFFIRGLGGFGDKGKETPIPTVPKRKPDSVSEYKTAPNLAFLYRLSGDVNPLHVDSDMAAIGGFEKPILHGLCTYGITA